MKKLFLLIALAVSTLSGQAQQKLYLSTYSGTDVARYDGSQMDVVASRYTCQGWNTLSLPFALSESQLTEAFGADCRLERLVAAEAVGQQVVLHFQDCRAEGVQANVPYILYYSGETKMVRLATKAVIENGQSAITLPISGGNGTLTMRGARQQTTSEGKYGILARDNSEAAFVNVSDVAGGFLATRCYIETSEQQLQLVTRHSAETTAIDAVVGQGERVDVYTVGGQRVATALDLSQIASLKAGVYVVKGRKVVVK
jgi:hypothetical protein